jgi:hypothetical protein
MSFENFYDGDDDGESWSQHAWWRQAQLLWDWDWNCYRRARPRRMRRGDTYVFEIQIFAPPPFGSQPGVVGTPQDITGWFLWFTVKYNYADPDVAAVAQSTTGNSLIVLTTPTAGLATVTMPAVNTSLFPDAPFKLLYDIQTKDTTSRISTVESGILIVSPDVTRALT